MPTPNLDGNTPQRIPLLRKVGETSRFALRGTFFKTISGGNPTVTLEADHVKWQEPLPATGVRIFPSGGKDLLVVEAKCISFSTAHSTGGASLGLAKIRINNGVDSPSFDVDAVFFDV